LVDFRNNVAFQTPDPTGGNRLVYLVTIGGTKLTGTNWVAELYAGPNGGSLTPLAASIAHFRASTTPQPGTWNFFPGNVTLPGFDVGSTPTLDVKIWDITKFSSYEAALAGGGLTSRSQTFLYTVPPAGSPPASFFMEGFQAFACLSCPEPSVLALGGVGIAGFLLIRRRPAKKI